MVKIQINLTDKENKIAEIYKSVKDFHTKEEAIKDMILKQKDVLRAYLKNI